MNVILPAAVSPDLQLTSTLLCNLPYEHNARSITVTFPASPQHQTSLLAL